MYELSFFFFFDVTVWYKGFNAYGSRLGTFTYKSKVPTLSEFIVLP